MDMPAQIQLKAVKTVEMGPENGGNGARKGRTTTRFTAVWTELVGPPSGIVERKRPSLELWRRSGRALPGWGICGGAGRSCVRAAAHMLTLARGNRVL